MQHPDEFLNHQRTLNEACFLLCLKAVQTSLKNPPYTVDRYIEHLRRSGGLQVVAAELSKVKGLL